MQSLVFKVAIAALMVGLSIKAVDMLADQQTLAPAIVENAIENAKSVTCSGDKFVRDMEVGEICIVSEWSRYDIAGGNVAVHANAIASNKRLAEKNMRIQRCTNGWIILEREGSDYTAVLNLNPGDVVVEKECVEATSFLDVHAELHGRGPLKL